MLSNPHLFSKLPYNPMTDFTHVTRLVRGPVVYIVRADHPARTMKELVQMAKDKPNTVAFGSVGTGSMLHLALNTLSVASGNTPFLHVPYKGSTPAMQDLLAGSIAFHSAVPAFVEPYVKSGRARALAVTSETRLRGFPDVPTLLELGYPDTVSEFMFTVVGPAKMPADLTSRIAADMGAVLRDPEFVAQFVDPFSYTVSTETPAEFTRYLNSMQDKVRARVRAANIQLD
jgi:tripartite-type tricarboxylate transporter receptor subunit TctC